MTIQVYNEDCLNIKKYIEKETVDLVITSPPYNIGDCKSQYTNFGDKLPNDVYIRWIGKVFGNILPYLKAGGRVCINLNQTFLVMPIVELLKKIGYTHRATIIWNKKNIPKRTAWGSWKSPSDPNILPPFEYIIVFHKEIPKHVGDKRDIDITKEEFITYTNSLWEFPAIRQTYKHCKAAFPNELPYRLMKLYSYRSDLILDPFMGTGTTLEVAKELDRRSVGFEIVPEIYNEALQRLKIQ